MYFARSNLRYAHSGGYTNVIYTNNNGEYMFTCGSDGDLRKWNSIDDDDPTSDCLGEFVLSIAMQGTEKLLASTDRNTVLAYTLPELNQDGVIMRFTAPCTCISVTDMFLAGGSDDKTIKVQRINDSDASNELQHEFQHTGPVLALDISPVSPYLASVGGEGKLKIFDLEKGSEVKSHTGLPKVNSFESALCYGSPTFEPCHGKLLAYAKDKEIIVLNTTDWEMQFFLADVSVLGNYTCCQFSGDGEFLAAGTTKGEISIFNIASKQTIECDLPISDQYAITSLAWKPKSNQELAFCDSSGQLGILYSKEDSIDSMENVKLFQDIPVNFDDYELEEAIDDLNPAPIYADDKISQERFERLQNMKRMANASDTDDNTRESSINVGSPRPPVIRRFRQQSAFQPSSTPNNLEHRYLVWNEVGIVTAHVDEGEGSIEVEFHDASVHHGIHIPNTSGHNMASLSSSVLALATDNCSKVVCIAFGASGNKEWSTDFNDFEGTKAIVATTQVIAVATSENILRIFSVLCTQRGIISLTGPVVALAGFEDRIIVVYHSSPSNEDQQYLGAMLVQFRGFNMRSQQITLPLCPGRQLTWLGFSDCGSPVFADSKGILQLFSLKGNFWTPICDTNKKSQSVSNSYFVIAVSEQKQKVQAIICRCCSYPVTTPRPLVEELSMQMPLCDLETEKSDNEDTLIRCSLMPFDNQLFLKTALKLFSLACRNDAEARAKELVEMIDDPEVVKLAEKYASRSGKTHLSEKLHELTSKMQQQSNSQKEFTINEPVIILPREQTNPAPSRSSPHLAPKLMGLSAAKRKRHAMSTSTLLKSSKDDSLRLEHSSSPLPQSKGSETGSQENVTSEKQSSTESQELSEREHSPNPVSTVNPFATKRKLPEDSDTNKGLLSKFKVQKKSN